MRKWRSSVARRIHFSFMLSAGLPLLILAVSAYQLVTHRLVTHALDDAHHLSKEFGMSVYDRLKFVADGLELVVASIPIRRACCRTSPASTCASGTGPFSGRCGPQDPQGERIERVGP